MTTLAAPQTHPKRRVSTPLLLKAAPILPGFSLSFGWSVFYISLVLLLPVAALLYYVNGLTWQEYWQAVADPRVVNSYKVTLTAALYSTLIALAVGVLLAWVIDRYEFPGRRLLDALVDLPFALPTSVAGLTFAMLLVPGGWLGQAFAVDGIIGSHLTWIAPEGIKISYAFPGIVVAMVFTSLPFVVRTVQPVLAELEQDVEEAAATLGATAWQRFRHVNLPFLVPALVTGGGQAFVRGLGEFGAVVMIAGNIPFKTEVTSLMIFVRLEEYNYPAAAAIASVVLVASLALLFALQWLQRRVFAWQREQ